MNSFISKNYSRCNRLANLTRTKAYGIIFLVLGGVLMQTVELDKTQQQSEINALLEEGLFLSSQVRNLYSQLGNIKNRLLQIAENENPYRRKTVTLESEMVQAVVMFKEDKCYQPKLMPQVQELLGDNFSKLFRIKVEYKGNYQPLRSFIATETSDQNEIAAKELIKRAEILTISQPYIKFSAKELTIQEPVQDFEDALDGGQD